MNNRRKTKMSGKKLTKLIVILVLVFAILTGAVLYLRNKVAKEYGQKNENEVTTATVTAGSISTSVYGSGTLSDDDIEQVDVPEGVTLTKVYVSRGDTVEEGDVLATVNTNSVLAALSELSEEMEELDEDIKSAGEETVSSTITASVSGRVKKIFAASGDNVASVMYENNALMLLSLDGYMKCEVETDALAADDTVTVTGADGKAYTGTVSTAVGGIATVLLSDNGPVCGDTVTVTDAEGSEVGTGTLEINSPLSITGYAGTVSAVSVSENSRVSSGSVLFRLSDTAYTANYETLLAQRSELEEDMQQLIKIYKEGAICASISGSVKSVSAAEGESDEEQYFTLCPDKTMSLSLSIDESQILSISVGQSASVSVSSIEDTTFTGTVTEIDKSGTSSSGVTAYTATVTVDKADGMLSGMSASATITVDSVEDGLIIPYEALSKTSSSYYVYTSYDEESGTLGGMTEVSVGITNSNYAAITEGLSEGDTVYYFEKEEEGFSFGGFGGGGMSFGGGDMPSFGGGDMSSFGGNMPSGGGNMPSGGGNMPSGGSMPGRG